MVQFRLISAATALLLGLGAVAGAARAADPGQPPAPTAPVSAQPPPPAPLPAAMITRAQAEAAVRGLFKLPETSDRLRLEWTLRTDRTATWRLDALIPGTRSETRRSLATVDAVTGRVLRYGSFTNIDGPVRTGPLPHVSTEAEARARAWALVQKLAPEKAPQLKEAPVSLAGEFLYQSYGTDVAGDVYRFTWIEYHNGIPFPASSVSVAIHKETLEHVAAAVSLIDSVMFRAGPPKVTADGALKLWQAAAKPSLSYVSVRNGVPEGNNGITYYSFNQAGSKLAYVFDQIDRPIDAMTGAWVKPPLADLLGEPPVRTVTQGEPVPPGSGTPVPAYTLPLNEADAQRLARAVLELPAGVELRPHYDTAGEPGLIEFDLADRTRYPAIRLDPKTGLIRSSERQRATEADTPTPDGSVATKVTREQEQQAKQAAFGVIQRYYSQLREELRYMPEPELLQPEHERTFWFARTRNGLAVPSGGVYVIIDLSTMTWSAMGADWVSGVSLPNPADAMAPERAKALAVGNRNPMLIYRPVQSWVSAYTQGAGPEPVDATLIYLLTPAASPRIDALTGEPLAEDGSLIPDTAGTYRQVAGHWAEGELQFVLSQRALHPDQLQPESATTRAQAVALLLAGTPGILRRGPSGVAPPYNDLAKSDLAYVPVFMAWKEGWFGQPDADSAFRPDAPITRAEFAVWAARALAVGGLVRSDLSVAAPYKDLDSLTTEQRNAVSFLHALGLLRSGATFRGADPLTQAEGAALTVRIYNYLLSR